MTHSSPQRRLPLPPPISLSGRNPSPATASTQITDARSTKPSRISALIQSLPREKWLLASQLQKAIRRGLCDVASATASVLCEVDQQYVVRRLPVIAYEDIGVANPPLLALAKHALRTSAILSARDACDLIAGIAAALAASAKSRTACDIASLVTVHDSTDAIEKRVSNLGQDEVAALAANRDAPLIDRAIAYRRLATRRRFVKSDGPDGAFQSLFVVGRTMRVPEEVLRLVVIGQGTYDLNCYLPLAHETVFGYGSCQTQPASRTVRLAASFGPVLQCALDIYTRVGQSAYRALIASELGLRRLLELHLKGRNRVRAVGTLLFYSEGSVLDRAITSDASKALLADVEEREACDCGFTTRVGARAVRRWLRGHTDRIAAARETALEEAMDRNPVHGGRR